MSLRWKRPHLRCGLCDEPFADGEATVYIDDEKCHVDCERALWPSEYWPDRKEVA